MSCGSPNELHVGSSVTSINESYISPQLAICLLAVFMLTSGENEKSAMPPIMIDTYACQFLRVHSYGYSRLLCIWNVCVIGTAWKSNRATNDATTSI